MSLPRISSQEKALVKGEQLLTDLRLPAKPETSREIHLTEISGSNYDCGKQYGILFGDSIKAFLNQEILKTPELEEHAKKCFEFIEKEAPLSATFMKGVSETSGVSIPELSMITLFEELMHSKPCSALVVPKNRSDSNMGMIGQTWDGPREQFIWGSLARFNFTDSIPVLAYQYPGLWCCAGVNKAGLSLMWTGAGYESTEPHKVGLPSYLLVAEVLRHPTVSSATEYLMNATNAGTFIFLLADASGDSAVIEAMPGCIGVEHAKDVLVRANHYAIPKLADKSGQTQEANTRLENSCDREKRLYALSSKNEKLSLATLKEILSDRPLINRDEEERMTLDSMIAIPEQRAFLISRGGKVLGPWKEAKI